MRRVALIKGEILCLLVDCVRDLAPTVADVNAIEPRKAVNQLVSLAIADAAAVPRLDDARVAQLAFREILKDRERVQDGFAVDVLERAVAKGGRVHVESF